MVSKFLDSMTLDEDYHISPVFHQDSNILHTAEPNYYVLGYDSYSTNEISSGFDLKHDYYPQKGEFLTHTQILQKRKEFEKFLNYIYKDPKELNRHFENVKSCLGYKIEQVFTPETMLEYFDRISRRPFSRIPNTTRTRWTDDEVILLTQIMVYYSYGNSTDIEILPEDAWAHVAAIFPNKDAKQLKKRWQGCLKRTLRQIPWTQGEDELLTQIMNEKGFLRKWKEIAEELNARSDGEIYRHGRQCRERWNNYLDPNITRGPFTEEEDAKLLRLYQEHGKKWAEISKKMKNRTENAVKNRLNALLKKFRTGENSMLSENLSLTSMESELEGANFERDLVDQMRQQEQAETGIYQQQMQRLNLFSKNDGSDKKSQMVDSDDSDTLSQQFSVVQSMMSVENTAPLNRNSSITSDFREDFNRLSMNSRSMDQETVGEQRVKPTYKFTYESLFPEENMNSQAFSDRNASFQGSTRPNSYYNEQELIIPQSPLRGRSNSVQPNTLYNSVDNGFKKFVSSLLSDEKEPSPTAHYSSFNSNMNSSLEKNSRYLSLNEKYKIAKDLLASLEDSPGLSRRRSVNDRNHNHAFTNQRASEEIGYSYTARGYDQHKPIGFGENKYNLKTIQEEIRSPEISKRLVDTNRFLKVRKLDKSQSQNQIRQANLQYAIVDLSKNEMYMVNPKEKAFSAMNSEEALMASPSRRKTQDLLFLGGSEVRSPGLNYLQSIVRKSNKLAKGGYSNLTTAGGYNNAHDPNVASFNDSCSELFSISHTNTGNETNELDRLFEDFEGQF